MKIKLIENTVRLVSCINLIHIHVFKFVIVKKKLKNYDQNIF